MYSIFNRIRGTIAYGCALLSAALYLSGCGEIAPTVILSPEKKTIPSEERGTIYPLIQEVVPGGLQSLDIPESYPTDIPTDCPGMVIVFSSAMENDGGEMSTSIDLVEESTSVPVHLNYGSAPASSRYFTLTPELSGLPLGELRPDTEYGIRIYSTAYADNSSGTLSISFDNLVVTPATSLNPAEPLYVEYRFRTAAASTADSIPPTVWATDPANDAVDVDPWLAPLDYIEITFSDNRVPMIDPVTVHTSSVTLRNVTDGADIAGTIEFVDTDSDFKTFRFIPFPDPMLPAGREFRLRISVSASPVKDFAGNSCLQTDVYFTTAP